jgi:hypothetical protein
MGELEYLAGDGGLVGFGDGGVDPREVEEITEGS